jgi:hypothetical protein
VKQRRALTERECVKRAMMLLEEHCSCFVIGVRDKRGRTVIHMHPMPENNRDGPNAQQLKLMADIASHPRGTD